MLKSSLRIVATVTALAFSTTTFAQQAAVGTAAEAKAMLEKAVAAVKADKTKALDQFNKGEGGFKDRDLYPFCGTTDGAFAAHPNPQVRAMKLKDLKDKNNFALGEEMYKVAKDSSFAEVAYMWPKPSGGDPVPKVSYVTKVSDLVCGVGYYK